jgi:predicted DCC family thiol-disulfide oxidoreductase YuxK
VDLPQRFLRFDARSLGLFRWLIGLTLITDLLHRWDWAREFYSNEGVLPNHNHLFILKDKGEVWSFYHAFSTPGEASFAFAVTLFVYLCFTLGWHTRAFHALSVVCLIALVGRNVLLDAVGNSVAIGLLAITLFVPLGLRFSLDALGRSFAADDEKTPDALNERAAEPEATSTLVPLALLGFLALVYYGAALQQTGETWKNGSALYYALHVDRWTSGTGVAVRSAVPAGALAIWTQVLRLAELAIVPLALVPVARRLTRGVAIGAMLFHGLTMGMLFSYGLYGWSLVAAAALLLPEESWNALRARHPIHVYYDDDCGICLWCARLIKRLDLRNNLRFFPNSGKLPKGVTRKIVEESIVVVDAKMGVHRDARAVSEIVRALPLLGWLGWLLRVPGLSHLVEWGYRKVAARRLDISVAVGLDACGAPLPDEPAAIPASYRDVSPLRPIGAPSHEEDERPAAPPPAKAAPSPAARTWNVTQRLFASAGAIAVLLIAAAQTVQAGELPTSLGLANRTGLASTSRWMRMTTPWGVWAPDPPQENAALVISAETRSGWKVDPLTGYEPDLSFAEPKRHRKGVLWEAYQRNIQGDDNQEFRAELRRYLVRGGWTVDTRDPEMAIQNLEVFWITQSIPQPGETPAGDPERREIFMQRGPAEREPPRIDRSRFPGLKPLQR